MLKRYSQVLITFLFALDILISGACWNFAYYLRFHLIDFPPAEMIPPYKAYFNASGVVILLSAFCFVKGKMYAPHRIARLRKELFVVIRACLILFALLIVVSFFYRKFSYSRVQAIYFLILTIFFISVFRTISRGFLSYIRSRGRNLRKILLIGNGKTAARFYRRVERIKALGFAMMGIVAREPNDFPLTRLGGYESIPDIIERLEIDQVYIALDSDQQSDLKEVNRYLAEQTVDLNIIPDIFHTLNISPEVSELEGMPVITLRQSPVGGWNRVFKRCFDILGGLFAIFLFFPFWIVLPLLIRLGSPGRVFYRQERMGLDGKKFDMIKFRTMKVDAENETGAVWAKKDDDRRTALGTFLRRTSLDEIPQFFNVLSGDMSLVGPRPERPVFIEKFKNQIPNYMLRHKMKAGITGWAQVNGWRGDTSLEKRIEFDIYYLTHWSIWLDLKILFMTVFTGFVHKNAY